MPLAISPDQSIKESLNSSRQISQGNRWQILGLILSTMIVAAPIATLFGHLIPLIFDLFLNRFSVNLNATDFAKNLVTAPISYTLLSNSTLMVGTLWGAGVYLWISATSWQMVIETVLPVLSMTTGAIALLPLWQLVKSALYYKLLCRQQGIDLKLLPRS
jgi:hypothetical protein